MPLKSETKFIERIFNGKYSVLVPEWQRLPNLDYEPQRTRSMAEHLVKGDVLLDIGASDGWLSAIYAQIVGAENLCIFEPSLVAWPTIKAIWDVNNLATPRQTFCGLVGERTMPPVEPAHRAGWPEPAYSLNLWEVMHFFSIKDRFDYTPMISIDDWVMQTGVIPRGISIDVEGAEVLVLRGAKNTIQNFKPLIWVSAHTVNGAIFYDYKNTLWDIFEELRGYQRHWLEVDGDEHWFFESL